MEPDVTHNRYWEEIEGIAKDALEEHPDDEDEQQTYVAETVDGHGWIIYDGFHEDVLKHTENEPDGSEVKAVSGPDDDWRKQRALAAFMSMEQDVLQKLEELRGEAEEED